MTDPNKFDDEVVEEFDIPEDEEPDPENHAIDPNERAITAVAIVLSITLFIGVAWRTNRGMFGHTPTSSLHTLSYVTVLAIFILGLSGHALKVTRPHEGTIIRGLALAAAVISALALLLLGNTIFTLLPMARQ